MTFKGFFFFFWCQYSFYQRTGFVRVKEAFSASGKLATKPRILGSQYIKTAFGGCLCSLDSGEFSSVSFWGSFPQAVAGPLGNHFWQSRAQREVSSCLLLQFAEEDPLLCATNNCVQQPWKESPEEGFAPGTPTEPEVLTPNVGNTKTI